MSRRAQENVVVLLLLAFFIAALVISLDYSPRARLVPVPVCSLAILLLLFQLVWQNLVSADALNVDIFDALTSRAPSAKSGPDEAGKQPEPVSEGTEWRRIVTALGFVGVLVAMVLLIGPIPAIFIFTFGYFVLSRHFSPAKAAAYTLVFTVAVYVVFVQVLQLQLYHGYLDPVAEFLRRL
jgi:hypothetical protein